MPSYRVFHNTNDFGESWWVYAVDEWDARDQIARTFGIDAQNRIRYQCREDASVRPELNIIIDAQGRLTPTKLPNSVYRRWRDPI
jgi:hypothetical protein